MPMSRACRRVAHMRKIALAIALLLTVGCGIHSTGEPIDGEGGPKGEWTTITTPSGRSCDLWTYSENKGYDGYGYAAMDCEERTDGS